MDGRRDGHQESPRARPLRWAGLIAAGVAAVLLLGAKPAQAGDEFEHGFKDEMGRIAAHHAAFAGRHLLGAILLGPGYAQPAGYGYDRGYDEPYGYGRPPVEHHHYYHVEHHYRPHYYSRHRHHHHHGCGHWDD